MATLLLTGDGQLANLDQLVFIEVEVRGQDSAWVVGRSAARESVLFKGTKDEAQAELLRIARIMNTQGHTIVDQVKGRIHHPVAADTAKTDKDGAPIDHGKIPEAFTGEQTARGPVPMNPEDYPPAFHGGLL